MDNVVVLASDGAGACQPTEMVIRQRWERPVTELLAGDPAVLCRDTSHSNRALDLAAACR